MCKPTASSDQIESASSSFSFFFFFGFPLPPSALLGYLPNGNNGEDDDNGTWSAWSCVDFLSFWKIEILLMCDFISNRTAACSPLTALAQHWEMIKIFVRRTDWDFFSFPSATGITAFEKKKKKSFCSSRYQSRTLGRTHLRQSTRNLQLSEIFFFKKLRAAIVDFSKNK